MNGKFSASFFQHIAFAFEEIRREQPLPYIARSPSHHALNLPRYGKKIKNLVNKVILKRAFANSANVPTSALLFQILMLCVRLFIN